MTFLSPIPAIIAASIAVPVLIAYYLLKLRRRPVRVSSTLLWVQAVRDVQVNVPFRWLRPTWLFFLQLAILALLLLAMARPAIDATGGVPGKVILVIDRTASMSAIDRGLLESRLELAKQEAMRTVDEVMRGSGGVISVAVIAYAAEPVAISSFTSDRGRIRSVIESITPTDQPGEVEGEGIQTGRGLQAALDLAGAMLAGDVEEAGPREHGLVILYSDAVSARREGYNLAGEFRFVRIGSEEVPDNLGIVALSARRDWESPSLVRVFARVVNAGTEAVAAAMALLVDGEEVERTALEVPGLSEEAVGEAAATFAVELRDGGVVTARLLRADALASDDEASIVVEPARRARVLVVAPDGRPAAEEEQEAPRSRPPEWLITELIREMRLPQRTVPLSIYEQQVAASGGVPAAELVIFDRAQPRRMPPVPTMTFGAGVSLDAVTAEPPPDDDRGTYFLSWQRNHPMLRHVALDSIYAARSLRLGTVLDEDAGRRPRVQELARGSYGPLILLIDDGGILRVVVAFELIQSNWPVHPGFMIFMASAIDYLTLRGEGSGTRAFSTVQPVTMMAPASATRVVLDGPRRIVVDVPPAAAGERGLRQFNIGILETAGVYRVSGASEDQVPAIAVNLADATESTMPVREAIRVGGETHAARAGAAGPREIWHWFVLAALGLLCVEWLLNAQRMRI